MTDRGINCTKYALSWRATHWLCSPWQAEVCTPPRENSTGWALHDRQGYCTECALHDRGTVCTSLSVFSMTEVCTPLSVLSMTRTSHRVCSPWQSIALSVLSMTEHCTEWAPHDRALHWVSSAWQRYALHWVCSSWKCMAKLNMYIFVCTCTYVLSTILLYQKKL